MAFMARGFMRYGSAQALASPLPTGATTGATKTARRIVASGLVLKQLEYQLPLITPSWLSGCSWYERRAP